MNIVGVSYNDPEKNKTWAESQAFPFELWSDSQRVLASHYGAARRLLPFPARATVVLDAAGQLVLEYKSGVEVGTHPQDVLEDCQALFGASQQQDLDAIPDAVEGIDHR